MNSKIHIATIAFAITLPSVAKAQQVENTASTTPVDAPASSASSASASSSPPSAEASTPPPPPARPLAPTEATRPVEAFTPTATPPGPFAERPILTAPPPIGSAWIPVPVRPMGIFGAPGSGVTFTTGDDWFTVNLRARVQIRDAVTVATSATANARVSNELSVRTIRLVLSGTIFSRYIQYGLQFGLAPADIDTSPGNTPSPMLDAWIGFTHLRDLNVRIGQFLVPFDRARANAEWGLQFADRALIARELGLDRDLGIDLGSNNVGGLNLFGYRVGVYGGDGRNRFNPTPGFLFLARAQINPLGVFDDTVEGDIQRSPRPRLSIGGAIAYNMLSDRRASTTGDVYTNADPTPGTTQSIPGFNYLHAAADITFKWRGISFLGQFLYRAAGQDQETQTTTPRGGMATTRDVVSRSAWGYLAQIGVMATSHLEFAARWEQLVPIGMTDMALITTANSTGHVGAFGINWYQWGHGFKAQADYQYQFGTDAAHGTHVARLLLQFSI